MCMICTCSHGSRGGLGGCGGRGVWHAPAVKIYTHPHVRQDQCLRYIYMDVMPALVHLLPEHIRSNGKGTGVLSRSLQVLHHQKTTIVLHLILYMMTAPFMNVFHCQMLVHSMAMSHTFFLRMTVDVQNHVIES